MLGVISVLSDDRCNLMCYKLLFLAKTCLKITETMLQCAVCLTLVRRRAVALKKTTHNVPLVDGIYTASE